MENKVDKAVRKLIKMYKKHIEYAYKVGYEDGVKGKPREVLDFEDYDKTKSRKQRS